MPLVEEVQSEESARASQRSLAEAETGLETQPLERGGSVLFAISTMLALLLAGAGFYWWSGHPMLINPDQALYVSMAQLLLEGRLPYVDMFDNNPPLAIYFQIPAVVLSQLWHMPLPLCFSMFVQALTLLSTVLIALLVWPFRKSGALLTVSAAALGFAYFNEIQRLDFGQREHLFCIIYMPFFILRYLRWHGLPAGRSLAILCGLLAGVGIAFKHYFLLIALAPELVWFLRERRWQPFFAAETAAAALVIFIYLLHFLFLPLAELQSFFGFIVPIYKEGYNYYVTSAIYNMATYWRVEFFWLALVSVLSLCLAELSSMALALCAFSFMSALVYVFAGQIWSYHMVPVRMANTMAFGVELVLLGRLLLNGLPGPRQTRLLAAAMSAACLLCGGIYLFFQGKNFAEERQNSESFPMENLGYKGSCPAEDIDPFVESCLGNSLPGDTVLFICASMAPGYPSMVQTGRRPGSRFIHAMILPILAYIEDRRDISEEEREFYRRRKQQVLDWYGADIERYKPALIYMQDNPMNWVLEKDNFVKKRMGRYRFLLNKDGISIYKRKP